MQILLLEDDAEISTGLALYLERAGYVVHLARDGIEALKMFFEKNIALAILDLQVPLLDGLEVLRSIRQLQNTPVILLTAKGEIEDRLRGFELGADDYIAKPFWIQEVLARVEAILKRSGLNTETVLYGAESLELHLLERQVFYRAQEISLRPTEFSLLCALLRVPNRIFSRQELLETLNRNEEDTSERAIDVHIKNIHKKLGGHTALETVFGFGYRYNLREI